MFAWEKKDKKKKERNRRKENRGTKYKIAECREREGNKNKVSEDNASLSGV